MNIFLKKNIFEFSKLKVLLKDKILKSKINIIIKLKIIIIKKLKIVKLENLNNSFDANDVIYINKINNPPKKIKNKE